MVGIPPPTPSSFIATRVQNLKIQLPDKCGDDRMEIQYTMHTMHVCQNGTGEGMF